MVNCGDQNMWNMKCFQNITYEFECFLFFYLQVKMGCHIKTENRETLTMVFLKFGICWVKNQRKYLYIVKMAE